MRKVIRSQATAFTYDRRVQPMPKLGPWPAELERMLEANETSLASPSHLVFGRTRWWGMLVVETIARIRREYFVKGKPIKEIVRDVKVSRNTVRKVIRSQATAFTYDRRVQPMPKLGPWPAELERCWRPTRPSRSGSG